MGLSVALVDPTFILLSFAQLQKLKGRRNRSEEINIVDVNADDQIGNSAEMVAKYGTEEVAHRPSRVIVTSTYNLLYVAL